MGARDGSDDLRAAATARDALEALKPALEKPWDDEDVVLVRGTAFDGWFGLEHLRAAADAGEVLEAGRGVLGAGGAWQMARVGTAGEAVTADDLVGVLDASQTCVLNSLDATCSRVAALSLAAIDAFGLPVCTNAYATGAGARISAPPHTDKQRVLVLQCHGAKRWRVWRPPTPVPGADPLARGKGADSLGLDELDATPALEATLEPGDVLYVPAGWPHTTDTLDCATAEPSVHLTVGVDTHVWGLDAMTVLKAARVDHAFLGRETDAPHYWESLAKTLPRLGWRATGNDAGAVLEALEKAAPGAEVDAGLPEAIVKHAGATASVIRGLYADVVFHASGASTATRAAPHFNRLEATMEAFLAGLGGSAPAPAAGKFAVGDKVRAPMAGVDELFDATVERVAPDGRLDVVYFDGDREFDIDPALVRRKKKKAVVAKGLGGAKKKKKKVKKR